MFFLFQAILLYNFVDSLDDIPYYHNVKIQGLQDLFCWIIASAPFLAIPACMIQACGEEEGSCAEVRESRFTNDTLTTVLFML